MILTSTWRLRPGQLVAVVAVGSVTQSMLVEGAQRLLKVTRRVEHLLLILASSAAATPTNF